jgi:preprotein translocase subunit Sec61beta
MSRKKRDEESIAPASSAGLLRFFQDESYGFKVKPEIVIVSAVMLMISVILAHVLYPNFI